MSNEFFVVGIHGAPTPETAPHGYMYVADGDWKEGVRYGTRMNPLFNPLFADDSVWWPLPAPPTEEAPAPEPVERWQKWYGGPMGASWVGLRGAGDIEVTDEEADAAADALNALYRDGVAWGPGRPMSELPDGHHPRVLLRADSGPYVAANTYRSTDAEHKRLCWWPLPVVES